MTSAREEIEKLVQQRERQRDELRVKIALAKLEGREEWEKLEKKWQSLQGKAPQMRDELGATADHVDATLRKLAEEIRDGYARLRKLL